MTHGADDPRLLPFDYSLPDHLIARYPPKDRDGGRLLDLRDEPADRLVTDLPDLLSAGDLLVVNNARVLSARLAARRKSGGAVEVLLLRHLPDADGTLPAMLKPSRRLKPGEILDIDALSDASIQLVEKRDDGSWQIIVQPDPMRVMDAVGALPLPPYFGRDAEEMDDERYQTVFASQPGAVAAPTAGLHLTDALLDRLRARGIEIAAITLFVGAGTFRNLRPGDLDRGELHAERYAIDETVAQAVDRTRDRGGRVIAVGTTTTRCLESAAIGDGRVVAGPGETRLFIRPGYAFQVVDMLWTNFHLPKSSLLMLICAFGGYERMMGAYRHAVAAAYRFYSYGDAMLISPERS
ncbi:MAG: tRNA preQ1(34) S-adenosylmethionine ribosyltransferase-isomerase QueA [Myxococcota bacterium]